METYQALLREQFVKKRKRNPEFSLRAFAKQLGMAPGGLSRLLNGKMGISVNRAHEIASKLKLTDQETETFLNLVQLEKAKTSETKERILKRIERTEGTPLHDLGVDHFKTISEWYPLAILKIASEPKMNRTVQGMSKMLGVSSSEIIQALERLQRLELVEQDKGGAYKRIPETEVHTHFKAQSDAARKYYGEVIEMVKKNVENELPATRAIGAKVIVLDESQLNAAMDLTLEYHRKLGELSDKSKNKEKVYQAFSAVFEVKS